MRFTIVLHGVIRMLYQALSVSDCKTASEMVAVYTASRKRLLLAGRKELQPLPPQMLIPPVIEGPTPIEPILAAVLTLDEVLPPKVCAQAIIAAVAEAHGVGVGDIKGPRRWMAFVYARHHAVALMLRHRPDLSLPLIGKLLNRDHTTIINSRRQWPKIAGKFRRQISTVNAALGYPEAVENTNSL